MSDRTEVERLRDDVESLRARVESYHLISDEDDKKIDGLTMQLAAVLGAILASCAGNKLADAAACDHCVKVRVNDRTSVCVVCHTQFEGQVDYGVNISVPSGSRIVEVPKPVEELKPVE